MVDLVLFAALLVTAYAGFALLALGQNRNWQTMMAPRPFPASRMRAMKAGGFALLAISLVIALLRDGPGFGAILWTVMLAIAAALVVGTLTWRAMSRR